MLTELEERIAALELRVSGLEDKACKHGDVQLIDAKTGQCQECHHIVKLIDL